MKVLLYLSYLVIGLFQLAAIMSGFEEWLGLHWFFALILGLITTYIPLLGTVLGMFGAVSAWDWTWLEAATLFLGPMLLIFLIAFFSKS